MSIVMTKEKRKLSAKTKKKIATNLWGYGFVSGSVLLVFTMIFYPLVFSFSISFQDWSPIKGGEWAGLTNYAAILKDELFWTAIKNNVFYAFWTVSLGFVFSFGAAVLVKSLSSTKIKNFLRSVYFIPTICNTVMITLLWAYLLQTENGLVNTLLRMVGVSNPPEWLASPFWTSITLYTIVIWANLGYWMIIFLTRLMDISESYYEAAKIDGADFFQSFRHITLPLSTPVIYLYLSMAMITCWAQFETPVALAGTIAGGTTSYVGPSNCLLLPSYVIYRAAFSSMDFGYSSAIGWVMMVLIMVIYFIVEKTSKSWVNYD